jgi:hypothetical protein
MRRSLGGTQVRSEAESHSQEANIAEVSHGKPVIGEADRKFKSTFAPPARERAPWHPPAAAPRPGCLVWGGRTRRRVPAQGLARRSTPAAGAGHAPQDGVG